MSDDHRAAVPTLSLGRSEAITRVATTLREHGLVCDGGIRGLHWDHELQSFSYDEDDHDRDRLPSIDAAVQASETWERVCLDFSGLSSSWELHASAGRTPSESHLSLILPHSLYKLAASEVATAKRLIHLLDDVRGVLGAQLLVCGTQVPEQGASLAELRAFVDRELQAHVPTALRLHTIVAATAIDEDLRRRHSFAEHWHRLDLSPSARAVSQLPIDE